MTATAIDGMSPQGLRERHRRQRAACLEETAIRLFAEHGFGEVTIEEIVAEADVSRRTFFRYFASKEQVLLNHHHQRVAGLCRALAERLVTEPVLGVLRNAVLATAGECQEERDELLRRAKIMAETPTLQLWGSGSWWSAGQPAAQLIAEATGVDPGLDLRPAIVAVATLATLQVVLDVWLAGGAKDDLPTLVGKGLDLLEGGFGQGRGWPPTGHG